MRDSARNSVVLASRAVIANGAAIVTLDLSGVTQCLTVLLHRHVWVQQRKKI